MKPTDSPSLTPTPARLGAGRTALLALALLAAAIPSISCELIANAADAAGNPELAAAARSTGRLLEGFSDENEYFYGRGVSSNIFVEFKTPNYRKLEAAHAQPGNAPDHSQAGQRRDAATLLRYVNLVGGLVAAASDRPNLQDGWHFGLIDSSAPMAFSAPGGFVYVSTGIIEMAANEDELAAVLAHEVAHVALEHGLESIKSETWKDFATSYAAVGGQLSDSDLSKFATAFSGALDKGWSELLDGYSAEKEYASDTRGLVYLTRVGYDPRAMAAMLQKLAAHQTAAGTRGGHSQVHPQTPDRIAKVRSYIRDKRMKGSTNSDRTARFNAIVHE